MEPDGLLQNITRRNFLKISAIWTGSVWIVGVSGISSHTYKVLTREEAEIMDALADCIIPSDDFAGGKEAGVTNFIDQQIGKDGYLQKDREMYKTCLTVLNRGSIKDYGKRFITLPNDLQTDYLKKMEAGNYDNQPADSAWGGYVPSRFFDKMRDQCMMGFYGGPKHGGNKNYVSYRMLRF